MRTNLIEAARASGARRGARSIGRGTGPALALLAALLLAACGAAGGGAAAPAAKAGAKPGAAKVPKIGIAFDVGGRGDQAFNDSAYEGLLRLAKEKGGRIVSGQDASSWGEAFEVRYLESRLEGGDREQLLRVLAEEGCGLVFAVGFLFTEPVTRVARDFPETAFALVDGFVPDLSASSNISCLAFAEEEGSFLVGALAGLAVADRPNAKLGFVGGMDSPLIHRFQAGFQAGAAFANPALRRPGMLLAQYIGKESSAFNDPKTAQAIASSMYRSGAEIVFHASGASGSGVFEAARAAGKDAIGVDSDQGLNYLSKANDPAAKETGARILSSMLKRVDSAVYAVGSQYLASGAAPGGYRTFSLADEGLGYAVNEHNKPALAAFIPRLEDLKARVVAGEIDPPSDMGGYEAFLRNLR